MMKRLAAALTTLALVAAFTPALTPALRAQEQIGISLGAKAPGAKVFTLDGKPTDLAQYIGKGPVLIEFWATWCGNCKELEPQLLQLVKKYSPKVRFVGVAVSVNQSPERVRLYTRKYHYAHTVLYDTNGDAVTAYDVPATSYIVVLDKAGKVVYTGLGGEQNLEAAVRRAL
ncbi:MAG TPA: TlpA disulfide reductase family protein [Gemmatimonadaceae bacterium]